MNKFLLIDSNHLFHRAKHSVRGNMDEKIGMCLHILFNSLGKAWRVQKANHIVFCFDSRSWRKDSYTPYKANRFSKQTPIELAENKLFFEAFDIFKAFVKTKTNCTILENSILEADDLISGFVQSHPSDEHIIVSSDGDFEQLLAPNVILYNGVADITMTLAGIFDYKGNLVKDKKTGNPKTTPNPEWSLFEKCMRGCTTDNIFSAYPGIREKGSSNKVGLREAFEDRHKQGFNWSAVMMHHWADHHGTDHKVLDDYYRNKQLIDLRNQPEHIKAEIFQTISDSCIVKNNPQIGLFFLKLCGKYQLERLSEQANYFAQILSSPYPNGR